MDKIYRALSNSTRRRIMEILSDQEERNATWILKGIKISQPSLSLHLNILERAGMVFVRREGLWKYYKFNKILWEKFVNDINKLGGSGLFEEIISRKV